MPGEFENSNPKIYERSENRLLTADEEDESISDEIDGREIFDLLRNVADPEYPLTLEELHVVDLDHIKVNNKSNEVDVHFTPTVPHCSMATLIGLSLKVQLLRALPTRFKINVHITPGSHSSEFAVNKQLNDKERVAAALENPHLTEVINHCIGKTLLH
ncbi:MIP18 protein galla-2 [Polyplax serrata]|uniref:MIP18 protein galla-2 n=1 Tax=Polyplax serrata TaxID=468196 RepID=A0AAN8SH17_POLSC